MCRESACPNICECFSRRQATFLILGRSCTRSCGYCRVKADVPEPVDSTEPARLAAAVKSLGLRSVVITSVARDDLADGGAGQFASTVDAIKRNSPGCQTEVLIPDFCASMPALMKVVESGPEVIAHNIETVPGYFPFVRPQADYLRSLVVLKRLVKTGARVKSGLMVGFGETRGEIRVVLRDLAKIGVEAITIGQYLPPSNRHYPVARYWRPEEFLGLAKFARDLGFKRVVSGPLVRSSYRGNYPERAGNVFVLNQ